MVKKKSVPKIYPLLVESIEHMKLTPAKKEFARAVLCAAMQYACARQAGFVMEQSDVVRNRR
jgi:hypothetical protein